MSQVERVARLSMKWGGEFLADYGSYKSRHDFTQRQLMSCLILRAYLKTTYRGVLDLISASDGLRRELGLCEGKLPHFSTLQKFSHRSDVMAIAAAILDRIGGLAEAKGASLEAIFDATGLESSTASAHFTSRRGAKRKRWVKVSAAIVGAILLPVGLVVDWGPTNDKVQVGELIDQTFARTQPDQVLADAGYDAEWIHQAIAQEGSRAIIKPVRHRKDGSLGGNLRAAMTPEHLQAHGYGRRWKVESFFSALKRKVGSTLNSRTEANLIREAIWKVLAYTLHR